MSSTVPGTSETDKREEDARPAWIAPATWAALPVLLRATLRCAALEADEIRAASPHLDRLLRTRYAREIAAPIEICPQGRSMLNSGEDTIGRSGLGGHTVGAHGGTVAPSLAAPRDSALTHLHSKRDR